MELIYMQYINSCLLNFSSTNYIENLFVPIRMGVEKEFQKNSKVHTKKTNLN